MADAYRSRYIGISLHPIKTSREMTFPSIVKKFRRRERNGVKDERKGGEREEERKPEYAL